MTRQTIRTSFFAQPVLRDPKENRKEKNEVAKSCVQLFSSLGQVYARRTERKRNYSLSKITSNSVTNNYYIIAFVDLLEQNCYSKRMQKMRQKLLELRRYFSGVAKLIMFLAALQIFPVKKEVFSFLSISTSCWKESSLNIFLFKGLKLAQQLY